MSSEREVTIFGQSYVIRGDDPDRIDRVAAYVDQKMNEVLKNPGQGLSAKGAVLATLNVAEELTTLQDEQERILFDLGERVDELLGLLPE